MPFSKQTPGFSFRSLTVILIAGIAVSCSLEAKKSRLLESADSYFKSGDYDKAKIEYLNLLRADHENAIAFQQLGLIWFEEGAPLRAGPYLLKARVLSPNNLENRIRLARVFIMVGQVAQAKEEALTVLQQSPASGEAIVLLTDAARTKEDIDFAGEQLQRFPARDSAFFHLATATLSLRRGDFASVENALQKAISLDPQSAPAHLGLAMFYFSQKNSTQAFQELKRAADLAPARSTERLKYAELKAQTGATAEAKVILTEMTRLAPDYLPAWCLLAQIAYDERKYDEALLLADNILARDAASMDAHRLRADAWIAKGEANKAVEGLEGLDKSYLNIPVIKYQLARAYIQNNNLTKAAVALNDAIAAAPDYAEAVVLLGALDLRLGNPQLVIASMIGLLKKQPDLMQARLLLGEAYEAAGRLDDAAALYREQIKLWPQSSQLYTLLGGILLQQQNKEEARKAFENALELMPTDLGCLDRLVELDISTKDFDRAMQRVQVQFQKTSESAGLHFMEAKIHAARGTWDRAESELLKTIALDGNFSGAYSLLISTYVATNRLPQAISQLEALLAKSPDDLSARLTLGLIYERMNDFSKAREAYEKLLSKSPDFAPALNNLAYLYAERLNELNKGYELACKAHTLQPDDAVIDDTLGWILYKRAEYLKALTLLRESAGRLQDNPEVQFHFGMANYVMGEEAAAKKALQKALNVSSDFAAKREIDRRLEFLAEGARPREPLQTGRLEAVVKEEPNDVVAWMRLGGSYENHGMWAKAADAFEEALKVNSELVPAAVKVAQLNAGPLKNKNKAFEFAKKARDLAPNDPQVAGLLGETAYQLGNFRWAYSLLQESARQLTNDAKVLHDYAWTAYSLAKVSEAQQTMRRVLEANPNPGEAEDARFFLAMTMLEQNPERLPTSEPEIERILATDSTYAPALMARARLLVQRGNAKSAATVYNDILRHYPDFAPAQKHLAALYLEDPARQADAYNLALKARNTLPDDPELAQIVAVITYQRKEYTHALQLLQENARKKPLDAKSRYYLGMCQLETTQSSQGRKSLEQALAAGLQEPFATEAKRVLAESNAK